MKNDDPKADKRTAMQAGETQVIDLQDVDVSAIPDEPSVETRVPPPLPPEVRASHLPSAPPLSLPPEAPGRSPLFYVGILAGVLALSLAIGVVVARSRQKPASAATTPAPAAGAPSAAAASTTAAPKVINLKPVDMNDDADGGP